jgi:hypothetical protein
MAVCTIPVPIMLDTLRSRTLAGHLLLAKSSRGIGYQFPGRKFGRINFLSARVTAAVVIGW